MKTLAERIDFLISQREALEKWVGTYDEAILRQWLRAEIGDERRLESWVAGSRAVARGPVLHIVSGNTEHAAFQSVFRAILIGCESWVKVPSAGLAEFEKWAAGVAGLDVRRVLPEQWRAPEVAIIYGGAETLTFFRDWLSPGTRITEHGPKLSAAFVFENRKGLAEDLAEDIMRYGQRGCLSVQMVYFRGDVPRFCADLAAALERYLAENGREEPDFSEAGGVRNERELTRFRIANGANLQMWESAESVDWTVVLDGEDIKLRAGPLSGFVRVVSMPESLTPDKLGPEIDYLSTAVLEPISAADQLDLIAPPRICAPGKGQEPGIFWHPDGEMPLAGLVRWRDLG
ncbi:acyl-CoA reductase [Luteolibacter algae]|uniref:Acyl-CoA reductase n=1 Tax=Luteolibacter algae TaxID=454151 RepID=A0ABW5D4J0_9BACT